MKIQNQWPRQIPGEQLERWLVHVGVAALRLTREDGLPWAAVEVGLEGQSADKLMTPRMVLDAACVLERAFGVPVRFVRMEPQAAEFVVVDPSVYDNRPEVFEEYGQDIEKMARAWGLPLPR